MATGKPASSLFKAKTYFASFFTWNGGGDYTDADDVSVLTNGKHASGEPATITDKTLAGVGVFIPFLSGGAIRHVFKGFAVDVKGYKYGNKLFKNAEQFGKAVTELAGNAKDKRALIESVTRDVAKTNGWKKSRLSGTSLGEEVYEIGKDKFASVDKYHGNFEIFEKKGKTYQHQGSIDIDGIQNKERNSKYDVKL